MHRPVFILCLLLCSLMALAQTETATLSGRVTDPQGAAVVAGEATVTNTDTGVSSTTKTDQAGIFLFPNLQPGPYRLAVQAIGFARLVREGLLLHIQDRVEQNVSLHVGSIDETVTVTADQMHMNTTDASVSTVIDQSYVKNIPLNGRSFQDLLTLAPGVALVGNFGSGNNTGPGNGGEITVNGQRTEANYFTVDGVSANTGAPVGSYGGAGFSGSTPGETVLGSTQAMVSIDALQEFRATTSTYSAEYGRTPGGQFSFTTRSGTNNWHGSAYDYFRNEVFDANNWFNTCGCLGLLTTPRLPERQNDFGGTLGGPLIIPKVYDGKDRTFVFFSYEGLRLRVPQAEHQISVPDMDLRKNAPTVLQPFLNAFPMPNGGEDGLNDGLGFYDVAYSAPSSIDSTSIRIDQNFGQKLRLFGRFSNTPSGGWTYGNDGLAGKTASAVNVRTFTLGLTSILTATQTNSFRFNATQNNQKSASTLSNLGGAAPIGINNIPGPGGKSLTPANSLLELSIDYGGSPYWAVGSSSGDQRQYNIVDTHTWVVGTHQFEFGIDWRRLTTLADQVPLYFENPNYFSEASILANSVDFLFLGSSTAVYSPTGTVKPIYHNFSAFIQDEWKATRRLSLSLGLRWDINPPPENLNGASPYTLDQIGNLATAKLAATNTPLWKTDWRGFAPRIGAAYQLRQTPGRETVLRAGFGVFNDMGNTRGSQGFQGAVGFGSYTFYSGTPFPASSAQFALPPPSTAPPYNGYVYAYDPNLRLPYTMEWNQSLEQRMGDHQTFTLSYLGSGGRKLLAEFEYTPASLGNPNFTFPLFVTTNAASSSYNSLQAKYQVNLSHGVQALASYTYAHSIDDATSNFALNDILLRASSDFDIRHNFQTAVTYDIPGRYGSPLARAILEHWGVETRVSARTALPINITYGQLTNPDTGQQENVQPELVSGEPIYLYGQYPGGRVLNYNAFTAPPTNQNGDTPRNFVRGFDAVALNLGLRRNFPIYDRLQLQFRAQAFNVSNHPNFGSIYNCLCNGSSQFGYAYNTLNNALGGLNALYQSGGPRSLQMMLKLEF